MTVGGPSGWLPPAAEVVEAEVHLDRLVSGLETSVQEILVKWQHRAEKQVLGAFGLILTRLESVHQGRLTELRTEVAELADQDGRQFWQAVSAYMEDTQQACIQPLQVFLGESNPLDGLTNICQKTRAELMAAVERLPERTTLSRPLDLYDRQRDQSLAEGFTRFSARRRDAWHITSRSASNALRGLRGGEARPLDHPVRVCAARDIASSRLLNQVVANLDESERRLRVCLSDELRSLEQRIWGWSAGGMRLLADFDSAAYHIPDDIGLEWSRDPPDPGLPSLEFCDLLSFTLSETPSADAPDCHQAIAEVRIQLAVAGTRLAQPGAPHRRSETPSAGPNFAFDRTRLANALLSMGRAVRELEDGLLREIGTEALRTMEKTYAAIGARLSEVEREALELVKAKPRAQLPAELEKLLQECGTLESLYTDLSGLSAADLVLTEPGESAWRKLKGVTEHLPSSLQLRSIVGDRPRAFHANLQKVAQSAFERPLSPRLKTAAEPLRRDIARVWSDTEHVMDVVRTTFGTTIQQLTSEEGEAPAPTDSELSELFQTGLRRAISSLEERYQSLGPDWEGLVVLLHEIMSEDWDRVLRAVHSEDFLAKQLLGLQTVLSRRAERTWNRLVDGWDSGLDRARAAGRLLRIRTRDLIRLGRTAVGASASSTAERHQALDTVASSRAVYASLPLVYRRLFSVEPVSDAGLAENRDDDLKSVLGLIHRWQSGVGAGALLVHGPLGSGRTTFLRLLEQALASELSTVSVFLDRRPASEEELAQMLANALYPTLSFQGNLDDLDTLLHDKEDQKSRLVLVDNLELLILQAPGGTDLLHKMLLFCIRTDDRVAWCGATTSLAWQFARRAVPGAARLAVVRELRSWDVSTLQDMILVRHRRSGIPLTFLVPEDPPALIGQRLKRAKTPEAGQLIMSGEFFDKLFRVAGQNPTRALFEWIRAGEFGEDTDNLCITPLASLSFDYLQEFEDNIAFTLRSLLVHNMLTMEEHDRIFRSGMDGAIMAFETLLSEGLIEAVDDTNGEAIVPGCRYRLRRLVLEPVQRSLKERHFVY